MKKPVKSLFYGLFPVFRTFLKFKTILFNISILRRIILEFWCLGLIFVHVCKKKTE